MVKIYGTLQKDTFYVSAEYGWPVKLFEWRFLLNNEVDGREEVETEAVGASTSDLLTTQRQRWRWSVGKSAMSYSTVSKGGEMMKTEAPTTKYANEVNESDETDEEATSTRTTVLTR